MQPFVTKHGIVVHHHEPECHAKKSVGFYLQGQGHSVGLYNQNMTVSTISFISSKPMSLMQSLSSSVVGHHKQRSVRQRKYWIAVVKVNVTVKVKRFN